MFIKIKILNFLCLRSNFIRVFAYVLYSKLKIMVWSLEGIRKLTKYQYVAPIHKIWNFKFFSKDIKPVVDKKRTHLFVNKIFYFPYWLTKHIVGDLAPLYSPTSVFPSHLIKIWEFLFCSAKPKDLINMYFSMNWSPPQYLLEEASPICNLWECSHNNYHYLIYTRGGTYNFYISRGVIILVGSK